MTALSLLAAAALQGQYAVFGLPIGRPGMTTIESGRLTNLSTGAASTADDVARAARGQRFVFLGEEHATPPDQQFHADVIEALARDHREVVVGLEMYQRPMQRYLDQFVSGELGESDFIVASDWAHQWGMDFGFYRPIFDVARAHRFPILGLNIPRDWVRQVGKGGIAALSADARSQLPAEIDLGNSNHRAIFDGLMGGHPGMSGSMMDNVYAAQVLWDVSMADTLAKRIAARKPNGRTVYVVIAGSGHLMYGQGINYRLKQRALGGGPTVVMFQANESVSVSNGLADFVYLTPKPKE
jgi:uncharacterized iron-regulated protein